MGPPATTLPCGPTSCWPYRCPFPWSPGRGRLHPARRGDELLTPYGLRSLAARDSAYHGRCEGDIWQRDAAYHQGTVWSWLIGPYLTAMQRVSARRAMCAACSSPC